MMLKAASTLAAVLMTAALGVVVTAKQVYKRLLGLKTLLDPRINEHDHGYGGFYVPKAIQRRFRRILFWRLALDKPDLFHSKAREVHEQFLRYVREQGWSPRSSDDVDSIEWTQIEADKDWFYRTYVVTQRPCVIKGFPVDSDWTVDSIREVWGDKPMLVHELLQGGKALQMTLNEMVEHNKKGGCAYMSFNRTFFDANRELLQRLHPEKLNAVLKKSQRDLENADAQIFISTDTPAEMYAGSPMHCANNINMFFNLQGRKRWVLLDPEFSMAAYPYGYIREKAVILSLVSYGDVMRQDEATDLFPLLKYVPRYSVDLSPGDVLFVPNWWWHSVETLSKDTLSVAMRLGPGAFGSLFPTRAKDPNSLFTTLQATSFFGLYGEIYRILYTRTLSRLSGYRGTHLRDLDIKTESQKESAAVYSADRTAKVAAWARPRDRVSRG